MFLYKYKGAIDRNAFKRDVDALTKNYFWGAQIDTLNDPCEALYNSNKFNQQMDGVGWLLGKKVKSSIQNVHHAFSNVLERNKLVGIFSLSQRFDDELLWAHYASSHKGYCVQYDTEILKQLYGMKQGPGDKIYSFPVVYSKTPPELNMGDVLKGEVDHSLQKLIGYKSLRWEYEKEFRIVTDFYGKFFHTPEAVRAIYFGFRMDDNDKELILRKLKGRGIRFYQIQQKSGSYHFEGKLLNELSDSKKTYLNSYSFKRRKVSLKVVEKKYSNFRKRGEIKIDLSQTISRENILELSEYLRDQLFYEAETVFIFYFQESQVSTDFAWGHSRYIDGKWEVGINDFTLEMN